MNKRYLAIIVVVMLMLVGIFSGCQKDEPTDATTTDNGGQGTTGEPVTVTGVSVTQSSEVVFPHPIENVLAEEANLVIEWDTYNITDWGTQRPVILASGDLPDLWFGASVDVADSTTGVFMDLAPYINDTTNIKRFFSEVPEAEALCTTLDGQIFGLPSKHALRPMAGDSMYVNKTWCDALGIELPTTLDEYENMLRAFVTQDPNGDGELNEVGYTGYNVLPFATPGQELNSMGALQCFFPSFGVLVSQGFSPRALTMVVDDEVVFAPTMEGFKDCLIWCNKLYEEGLIDNELFTLDPPAMMAKLSAAEGVMAGASSAWSIEAFCFEQSPNFAYIEPLEGPNGEKYWRSDYAFSMRENSALIAATCTEPEAVMNFFDLCYDEYNSLQIAYGSDGVGTSHDESGNPIFLTDEDGTNTDSWRFKIAAEGGPGWASPEYEATIGGTSDVFLKYEASDFYADYFMPEFRYPQVKWTQDQTEQLSTLQTDINSYVDTALVGFVMNGNVEEGWQDYLDKLDKMGLPALMEIYVAGYESSMK